MVEEADTEHLTPVAPDPVKKSNIDLVNECDNFPYPDTDPDLYTQHVSTYYHLFIPPCPRVLGYLLPSVALTLQGTPGWTIDESERTVTLTVPEPKTTLFSIFSSRTSNNDEPPPPSDPNLQEDKQGTDSEVAKSQAQEQVKEQQETQEQTLEQVRSAIIARTCLAMRATGHFSILQKWRNELYPIYYHNPSTNQVELLCSMERSASALFGIVTYGAHMTAYVRDTSAKSEEERIKGMRIWVPRRAREKQTYGGMLDQTVAGGISTGETPLETLVREAEEEACLSPELVRNKARPTGAVTYFHIRDHRAGGEIKLLQPECQYSYEMDLTPEGGEQEVTPKSGDEGEVGEFLLMTLDEARDALSRGEFKPNCALVLLNFLIRHGVLTAENEKDYLEICQRLHRRLEFPTA